MSWRDPPPPKALSRRRFAPQQNDHRDDQGANPQDNPADPHSSVLDLERRVSQITSLSRASVVLTTPLEVIQSPRSARVATSADALGIKLSPRPPLPPLASPARTELARQGSDLLKEAMSQVQAPPSRESPSPPRETPSPPRSRHTIAAPRLPKRSISASAADDARSRTNTGSSMGGLSRFSLRGSFSAGTAGLDLLKTSMAEMESRPNDDEFAFDNPLHAAPQSTPPPQASLSPREGRLSVISSAVSKVLGHRRAASTSTLQSASRRSSMDAHMLAEAERGE